ncbi:hypothetical protein GE107_24625 [Cohnella sp. CFH 77786]|nr:hypothetical protein [Cohnella sp. CFH 77786]
MKDWPDQSKIETLVQQIRNGETSSFKELTDRYYQILYSFAFRILKNKHESEDVLQETFLRVYLHIDITQAKTSPPGSAGSRKTYVWIR